jgi:hypothetical protein
MGIPNIPNIQVNNVGVYQIPTWQITQPYIPNFYPVTNHLGFPIVDIPGCVKTHKDNKRHKNGVPIDKNLVENDPGKAMTLCPDGSYPTYDAMNYEPEQLTIIRETPPPPVAPPPEPPGTPETPDTGDVTPDDPPCPGPNAQRIGDIAQNQTEKVSGFELQPDPINQGRKICVVLYEDIGAVEQYLPTAQIASTTAVIATVATGSALLAKPLADLMLRVFRPAIKKVVGTIQKVLGKEKKEILSLRERMDLQRDRTRAIREFRRMRNLGK